MSSITRRGATGMSRPNPSTSSAMVTRMKPRAGLRESMGGDLVTDGVPQLPARVGVRELPEAFSIGSDELDLDIPDGVETLAVGRARRLILIDPDFSVVDIGQERGRRFGP